MPGRRRGFSRPFRPPGSWAGVVVNQFTLAANTKVLAATFSAPVASSPQTVRRVHISVLYSSDQNVGSEATLGVIGMGVFNDTAIAVGVGSLPDPATDVNDDVWFLFQGMHTRFSFSAGGGIAEPAGSSYEISSKGMRKIPEGKSACIIVVNNSPTFGAVCQLTARLYSTDSRS